MFGDLIGDLFAAPLRIVNLPARLMDVALGDEPGEGPVSEPIEDVAQAVDDAVSDAVDYVCGDD